jgi:hypothetical protein
LSSRQKEDLGLDIDIIYTMTVLWIDTRHKPANLLTHPNPGADAVASLHQGYPEMVLATIGSNRNKGTDKRVPVPDVPVVQQEAIDVNTMVV